VLAVTYWPMDFLTRDKLRTYAAVFLAWTVIGLFFFSQGLTQKHFSHDPTPWWHYLLSWLTGVYLCALLTLPVLWLGRRFPIERRNWLPRSGLHLLCSLIFSVVELAAHSVILHTLGLFPTVMRSLGATFALLMMIAFHQNVLTYWAILGVQYALRYYRSYREREREALRLELQASVLKTQLAHAQLSALKMQLHPHFLFNTMNAIMVLVRQQRGPQAEEMLARLSDLLRLVLEDVDTQEVPLRRELEYLELYLAIEQVRFADRLRVNISADPAILDAAVPHLGLQPIVENAIRHGIGRSSAAGNIQIAAFRRNDTLEITIGDDGPGFPPVESTNGRGIGLANTRARLHQLYGDAARLRIENAPDRGAIVTISLPYHVTLADSPSDVMELHAVNDVAG
jgi:two-component system LytT family sensor kinase